MLGVSSTMLIAAAVVVGGLVVVAALVLQRFRSDSVARPFGNPSVSKTVQALDATTGSTFSDADSVVGYPEESADPTQRGIDTDSVQIDLTDGTGTAEIECRTWIFEVRQDEQIIGRQRHEVEPESERDHIGLPVEPYIVDVQTIGGPERDPLSGATVEATADIDEWTDRGSTDAEGTVPFEVPRSASTVTFTAEYGDLPRVESKYAVEQATQGEITLEIAAGTGSIAVETAVGDCEWPDVEIRIIPTGGGADTFTEPGTVTTNSAGRRVIANLPVGTYDVSAHPQFESITTTEAVESVTVDQGTTAEVTLTVGASFAMETAQRERLAELRDRIGGLATDPAHDTAIPHYYGTALSSVLELVDTIETAPEHTVAAGFSPDATIEALLDATEVGLDTVTDALSEQRVVGLFEACEAMSTATVDWNEDPTLEAFLDRVNEGAEHEKQTFRGRLDEVDEFLNQRWGDVNETAPARALHDRLGQLGGETVQSDDELAVVAQAYVGLCLLDAIEELFEHDALVDRLNGRTL